MVYQYNESIQDGYETFPITNHQNKNYDVEQYNLTLYPLYINEYGHIYFNGISHSMADLNLHFTNLLLADLISSRLSLSNCSLEKLKELKLQLFKSSKDLSLCDLKQAINYPANPYKTHLLMDTQADDIYTSQAMDICNTVLETKYQIARRLKLLSSKLESEELIISELFQLFNIPKIGVPKRNYMDDCDYIESLRCINYFLEQISSDFFVMGAGLDKIETSRRRTISTSKLNIYETYFNYMIMGYSIVRLPKIVVQDQSLKLEEPSFITSLEEKIYEQEISLIKQKVRYEDRHKYFIK